MSRNIAVGIDIGTYSTNTAVLELDEKDNAPKILALNSVPSAGVKKGGIFDIKDTANSIRESVKGAENSANLKIRGVYVSIGGVNLNSAISKGIAAISRADGEITEHDKKRAIQNSESNLPRMANKTIIDTIPLFYKIDGEYVGKNPTGMKGGKLEVETLFITNLSQNLNNLIQSVESAGLNVEGVSATPVASGKILLDKRHKEVGSLLFDMGGGTISLAVFEDGNPIYINNIPFGSDSITNDIALGAEIPLTEAEKIKHIFGKENSKFDRQTERKLGNIIEARLAEAFDLTANHLRKIGKEKLLPGGIILTGGGINIPRTADLAKNHLKMNTEIGICNNFETKEKRLFDSKWPVAIGLALTGLEDNRPLTNPIFNKVKSWLKAITP